MDSLFCALNLAAINQYDWSQIQTVTKSDPITGHTISQFHLTTEDITFDCTTQLNSYALTSSHLIVFTGTPLLNNKAVNAFELATAISQNTHTVSQQLTGHFALIIIALNSNTVMAMTDKFGTRNLYYFYDSQDNIIISSRLAKIAKQLPQLAYSQQAIYHYIYFHCIPSPDTIYQNIYKLEPATQLTLSVEKIDKQIYWLPEFNENTDNLDTFKLSRQLIDELKAATVPYSHMLNCGTFLSGGLDSSSVTATLALQANKAVNTFTIGFQEPGYDETEYARIIADKYATRHFVYNVTPEDIFEYLPKIAAYYDEPFGNSSALPTFFCSRFAKEQGVSILLAGDGGDELFAGNERYAKQKDFDYYQRLPNSLKTCLSVLFFKLLKPVRFFPVDKITDKACSYITQAEMGLPERLQYYNYLQQLNAEDLFSPDFLATVDQQKPLQQLKARYQQIGSASDTNKMLYLDWKFTLADNDLVKVNYMTEMAGIKVIYPMLSEGLTALSTQLPGKTKLPARQLRLFYKRACQTILPYTTLHKSKHGFGLPFGKWLKTDTKLKKLANDALSSLADRGIFQQAFIQQVQNLHEEVHAKYYGELVWIMMMLELWFQAHESDLSAE